VTGTVEANQEYEDDFRTVVLANLTSLSGFWFDCVTSIPWSWLDLHIYLVRWQPCLPRLWRRHSG
jgi:hypothetical protein